MFSSLHRAQVCPVLNALPTCFSIFALRTASKLRSAAQYHPRPQRSHALPYTSIGNMNILIAVCSGAGITHNNATFTKLNISACEQFNAIVDQVFSMLLTTAKLANLLQKRPASSRMEFFRSLCQLSFSAACIVSNMLLSSNWPSESILF